MIITKIARERRTILRRLGATLALLTVIALGSAAAAQGIRLQLAGTQKLEQIIGDEDWAEEFHQNKAAARGPQEDNDERERKIRRRYAEVCRRVCNWVGGIVRSHDMGDSERESGQQPQ
jgi:hypothetical protein